jgi:hypothetical protein
VTVSVVVFQGLLISIVIMLFLQIWISSQAFL